MLLVSRGPKNLCHIEARARKLDELYPDENGFIQLGSHKLGVNPCLLDAQVKT